jgi:tetratricopeptide (TPR) repeat protein
MTLIRSLVLSLFLLVSSAVMAHDLFDLFDLWDYSNPALSEQRFRETIKTVSKDDGLILQTQIARTYVLRRDFARAQEILGSIKDEVKKGSAELKVWYFLELGRTYTSVLHAPDAQALDNKEKARSAYMQAFEVAKEARLDYLAIDALHMMTVVDTEPTAQIDWNLKALTYLKTSSQPEARRWAGSLHHNIGEAQYVLGKYDEALIHFMRALVEYEFIESVQDAHNARWQIARIFRTQGRFEDALDIQLRLEQEGEQANNPDPRVFEELEHLFRQANDIARTELYATKLRIFRSQR